MQLSSRILQVGKGLLSKFSRDCNCKQFANDGIIIYDIWVFDILDILRTVASCTSRLYFNSISFSVANHS